MARESDELTATTAQLWRDISALLEHTRANVQSHAEALALKWKSPAATSFLTHVGAGLYSLDEWKKAADENASALGTISVQVSQTQTEVKKIWDDYKAKEASEMADRKDVGIGDVFDGNYADDYDEVSREYANKARPHVQSLATAYTEAIYYKLGRGTQYKGPIDAEVKLPSAVPPSTPGAPPRPARPGRPPSRPAGDRPARPGGPELEGQPEARPDRPNVPDRPDLPNRPTLPIGPELAGGVVQPPPPAPPQVSVPTTGPGGPGHVGPPPSRPGPAPHRTPAAVPAVPTISAATPRPVRVTRSCRATVAAALPVLSVPARHVRVHRSFPVVVARAPVLARPAVVVPRLRRTCPAATVRAGVRVRPVVAAVPVPPGSPARATLASRACPVVAAKAVPVRRARGVHGPETPSNLSGRGGSAPGKPNPAPKPALDGTRGARPGGVGDVPDPHATTGTAGPKSAPGLGGRRQPTAPGQGVEPPGTRPGVNPSLGGRSGTGPSERDLRGGGYPSAQRRQGHQADDEELWAVEEAAPAVIDKPAEERADRPEPGPTLGAGR